MAGSHLLVKAENCSGCLRCSLACSFFNTGDSRFALTESKIVVTPNENETWFDVEIREDCMDCGMCVEHCDYGALIAC